MLLFYRPRVDTIYLNLDMGCVGLMSSRRFAVFCGYMPYDIDPDCSESLRIVSDTLCSRAPQSQS